MATAAPATDRRAYYRELIAQLEATAPPGDTLGSGLKQKQYE